MKYLLSESLRPLTSSLRSGAPEDGWNHSDYGKRWTTSVQANPVRVLEVRPAHLYFGQSCHAGWIGCLTDQHRESLRRDRQDCCLHGF